MKNNKNKKIINKYDAGGTLSAINSMTPLLSLLGPYGMAAGAAINAGTSIYGAIDANNKRKQAIQEDAYANPNNYRNTAAFGYQDGGSLNKINSTSQEVNSNPNITDAMQMNYKGQPIRLDDNETLDTQKERVVSNKIMYDKNKSFADIDRKYKTARGKSEDMMNKSNKSISQNTIDFMKMFEDNLFAQQEITAKSMGLRDNNGQTIQNQEKAYAPGGPIDPLKPLAVPTQVNSINDMSLPLANASMANSMYDDISRWNFDYSKNKPIDYGWDNNTYLTTPINKLNPNPVNVTNPLPSRSMEFINKLNKPIQPDLSVLNLKNQATIVDPTKNKTIWDSMTTGEKVASVSSGISLIGKTIESLQPLDKVKRYSNSTPISLQQLDPTYALNKNNQTYLSQLNNIANETGTMAQRNLMGQGYFDSKLKSDSDILNSYNEKNIGLKQNYEDRLNQRNEVEINRNMQADDIDAQRKGVRQNMRMGALSDIATYGNNIGRMLNNKQSEQTAQALMAQLAPDVYGDMLSSINTILNKSKK